MIAAPSPAGTAPAKNEVLRELDQRIEFYTRRLESIVAAKKVIEEELAVTESADPEQHRADDARQKQEANGAKRRTGPATFDPKAIVPQIAHMLAPEFTSHQFREKCIELYPGRDHEFTLIKINKRLKAVAGFEDEALLTLLELGAGRRPPRYKVNRR